jgi:phosphate transport system protein
MKLDDMRSRFDEQLSLLNKELITMGALCEEAISLDLKALSGADKKLAEKIAPLNTEIDQMERDIENLCMKMLLQQQPVAGSVGGRSTVLEHIHIGDFTRTLQ